MYVFNSKQVFYVEHIKLYQNISNNIIYNPNDMLKNYYKVKNKKVVKNTKRLQRIGKN